MSDPVTTPSVDPPEFTLRPRSTQSRWGTVHRRWLVLLVCAPLLGLLGVIVAEAVPDRWIADHLVDGERAGLLTGGTPTTPLDTRATAPTECLGFSVGLGDQPGRNHVTTAIVSPAYDGAPRYRPCVELQQSLEVYEATGTLPPGNSYLRYWHGYAVITRPALALFGVAGTRWIAFALAVVAGGAMAFAVARAFGWVTTAVLVAPTLLTTDAVIGSQSAQTAIGMATAWAGGWIAFSAVARRPDWRISAVVAAVAGIVSAYFDLMNTMPGAWGLAVVGAVLGVVAANGVAALRDGWRVATAAAVGWVVGLVWMWGAKWVIAAMTVGVDAVFDDVQARVDLYVSDGRRRDVSRLVGLTDNLDAWWSKPLTPWVVLAILAVLVVAAVRGRRPAGVLTGAALCAAIAVVPAVGWYVALNTHSQIHDFLVYRSFPIVFGAVAALMYVALTGGVERTPVASTTRPAGDAAVTPTAVPTDDEAAIASPGGIGD